MAFPRAPTNAEWNDLHAWFPHLNRSTTQILNAQTPLYNCIAWSMGLNDRWVNPSRTLDLFKRLYARRKFVECPAGEATVDGYAKNQVPTHASKVLSPTAWQSKLGASWRIQHERNGLEDAGPASLYGVIVVHFKPAPVAVHRMEVPAEEAVVQEEEPVTTHAATVSRLVTSLNTAFPTAGSNFETLYAAWKATWFKGPHMLMEQSSAARAQGPEWDALVKLGPSILPQVVHKLSSPGEVFAIELYNKLETDPKKKVHEDDVENFCILQQQAGQDIKLFSSRVTAVATKAAAWTAHQDSVKNSGNSDDFLAHESYDSLVQMGPPVIGPVMEHYAKDQHGWWHELLHEIVHGRRSESEEFHKPTLYNEWKAWFEGTGGVPGAAETA